MPLVLLEPELSEETVSYTEKYALCSSPIERTSVRSYTEIRSIYVFSHKRIRHKNFVLHSIYI